jgi:predicted dehydrogenase
MTNITRRSFVTRASISAAAGMGGFVNLNPRAKGANEKIILGLIGGRNQGRGVALRSIREGAEIKTFCDIDDEILRKVGAQLGKAQNKNPETVKDFHRVLDDKDVDGVIVAPPDHWHTHMGLLACQAGKDIYLEKPLTQTIHEGQLLRDAVRKYRRIMQVGTMRRSGEHFRTAAEYVASGKLGKLCLIKAWICQVRNSIGQPPNGSPPAGADYDMWLGPAPKRPFNQNRFHYNWRFFWDYGNTELGNQGVHMLDVAIWAIQQIRGLSNCLPTRVSDMSGIYWLGDSKEVPDTQVVNYDYGDFMLVWELRSFARHMPMDGSDGATAFYGSEAALIVDDDGWKVISKSGEVGPVVKDSGGSHEGNFLACMKSRKLPNADVEIGRLSTTLCHLGNVSCRLHRDIRFDPKTETFPGDKGANAMLRKEYRPAYPLPKV